MLTNTSQSMDEDLKTTTIAPIKNVKKEDVYKELDLIIDDITASRGRIILSRFYLGQEKPFPFGWDLIKNESKAKESILTACLKIVKEFPDRLHKIPNEFFTVLDNKDWHKIINGMEENMEYISLLPAEIDKARQRDSIGEGYHDDLPVFNGKQYLEAWNILISKKIIVTKKIDLESDKAILLFEKVIENAQEANSKFKTSSSAPTPAPTPALALQINEEDFRTFFSSNNNFPESLLQKFLKFEMTPSTSSLNISKYSEEFQTVIQSSISLLDKIKRKMTYPVKAQGDILIQFAD